MTTFERERERNLLDGVWALLCAGLLFCFFGGWVLMLLVGIVHGSWIHALPTIGYKAAFWVFSLAVGLVTGTAAWLRATK